MLVIDNLSVRFGGNIIIDGVSFSCSPGEVTAIIGPNGAGKTTLFDTVTGYTKSRSGSIRCDGVQLCGMPTFKIGRSGLARTFQTPRLFEGMTVLENLVVASNDGGLPRLLRSAFFRVGERSFENKAISKATYWLEFLKLTAKRDVYASDLSGGQRKLVELGRALMTEPRYILLDEPVAGVAPALVNEIGTRLQELAAKGLGVIIIEHNMDFIMRISNHVVVLASGKVLARGTAKEIQAHPEVLEAYLGGAAA